MEMFLRCVIFFVFPIAIVSQDQWSCRASQFKCKNHRCFSIFDRCDGQDHCGDGSDEEDCDRWKCPAGVEWWQCSNAQCVRTYQRCDGNFDCRDHSDENSCDQWTCPAGGEWWQCKSNQCVRTSYRCDGRNDCRDDSDEDNCGTVETGYQWSCPASQWKCNNNNRCVWLTWRCDGQDDCGDGSDEEDCEWCTGSAWKCSNNNRCIGLNERCDGHSDCVDGSDEYNCDQWMCPTGGEWWQCSNKKCIQTSQRCDGYKDCGDDSDEKQCDYRLPQCTNGILQISETELHELIYCDGLQGRDYVNWERNEGQGETSNVAFCRDETQNYSCNSVDRDVRVSRNTSTSQLVIVNYTRANWANSTLTCVGPHRVRTDSCRIRVMYPAVLGNSTVTLHDNFTVTATVTVEKVFDSDFNITCLWNIVETKHSQTTHPSLSSFTETQTGRVFHNGTCSLMINAPSVEGNFLVYVTMEPGGGLSLVGDFNITKPDDLRLQTQSCPEYVAEGQTLQCQCRHVSKDKGSPPARVSWGQQSGSAVLTVNKVTMKDNGTVYTCNSTWGPSGEVQTSMQYMYIIRVADGKHTKSSIVVVGGGIAGGVFIIAVVIVIVVVKLKCRDDNYEKPRRRRNRGTSHVYLDLDPISGTASATSQATISVDNTSNPQPSSVTSGATGDAITRKTRLHADRDLSARGGNSESDYLTPSAGDSDYTEIKDEEEEHKYTNDSVQPTAAADDHYANDPQYTEIKEPLPQDLVPQTAARRRGTEPSPYEEVE